jgi:hypothetical protein
MRVAQVITREPGWSAEEITRFLVRCQEGGLRFRAGLPAPRPVRIEEVMSA